MGHRLCKMHMVRGWMFSMEVFFCSLALPLCTSEPKSEWYSMIAMLCLDRRNVVSLLSTLSLCLGELGFFVCCVLMPVSVTCFSSLPLLKVYRILCLILSLISGMLRKRKFSAFSMPHVETRTNSFGLQVTDVFIRDWLQFFLVYPFI